jgi:hypothetical protein
MKKIIVVDHHENKEFGGIRSTIWEREIRV